MSNTRVNANFEEQRLGEFLLAETIEYHILAIIRIADVTLYCKMNSKFVLLFRLKNQIFYFWMTLFLHRVVSQLSFKCPQSKLFHDPFAYNSW